MVIKKEFKKTVNSRNRFISWIEQVKRVFIELAFNVVFINLFDTIIIQFSLNITKIYIFIKTVEQKSNRIINKNESFEYFKAYNSLEISRRETLTQYLPCITGSSAHIHRDVNRLINYDPRSLIWVSVGIFFIESDDYKRDRCICCNIVSKFVSHKTVI